MNKLLSQITFTSNEEKEKINYLNYSPPTTDEFHQTCHVNYFLFNVGTCENFV